MCNLFKPQSSTPAPSNVKSYEEVVAIFRAAGVTCEIPVMDDYYWYPDENTWIEILKEAHASAPAYESITAIQPGFDCDKFAHHFCDVAYLKKANGCWRVAGKANLDGTWGNHAWNVFVTPIGTFEAEPQEADIWPIGMNPNYQIKTVYHAD